MFEDLSEKLEATFARLRGRGVLTEADIKEGLREVRRVLLEADVNFALTREFLERVERKAVGVSQLRTVSPGQQLVKIVYDELAAMLKGEGRQTRLIACDVYRPAAIDQLETLGKQLDVPVYADRTTTDVVKI